MDPIYKLKVKGMVCNRCIHAVSQALSDAGIPIGSITLGEVAIPMEVDAATARHLEKVLQPYGFSLVNSTEDDLVTGMKNWVAEVYNGNYDFPVRFRFAERAAQHLQTDYKKLYTVFTQTEGQTPEQYVLAFRIQKIKDWLIHTDATLEDLSFRFGFSSTAHLSRQFRQLTGMNASSFRDIHRQTLQT